MGATPVCDGTNLEHCCTIRGVVCPYLVSDVNGRNFGCGLFVVYGSWTLVHESEEWKATDAAVWFNETYPGFGCGDWPQNIPNVSGGLCCWDKEKEVSIGNLG